VRTSVPGTREHVRSRGHARLRGTRATGRRYRGRGRSAGRTRLAGSPASEHSAVEERRRPPSHASIVMPVASCALARRVSPQGTRWGRRRCPLAKRGDVPTFVVGARRARPVRPPERQEHPSMSRDRVWCRVAVAGRGCRATARRGGWRSPGAETPGAILRQRQGGVTTLTPPRAAGVASSSARVVQEGQGRAPRSGLGGSSPARKGGACRRIRTQHSATGRDGPRARRTMAASLREEG